MSVEVTMPQLGETVTEGTVTRWLKAVGDSITDQEPLVEIATDKVDTEIPATAAGTLQEILVAEGNTVGVGTVLAVIDGAGAATTHVGPPPLATLQQHRHQHSPMVRRRAAEASLNLRALTGSGPGGRVTRADLDQLIAAAESSLPAAPPVSQQAVVADPMITSQHRSGPPTTVVEVDVTDAARRSAALTRAAGPSAECISLTAVFAWAVLDALRSFPILNASLSPDGGSAIRHKSINLGIAVDTSRGVLTPVVKEAGDLNLVGLARRIAEVADAARAGSISVDDLSGSTFTLTNTGSRGALFDTLILVPGQVGTFGAGALVERPVVVRDAYGSAQIAVRSMAYLSLTYDHRFIGSADAARFLTAVRERLETGSNWLVA